MTVEEFFKAAKGSESLCKDLMNHDVQVRLKSREGMTISDHFKLTHLSYMFSPWLKNSDGTQGSLVIEFQVE